MQKNFVAAALVGFCLALSLPVQAETAGPSSPAVPVKKADAVVVPTTPPGFPLMLKGTEILISTGEKREDLTSRLGKIIGESTPMEEKSRLQYDVQLDAESAPITLIFDWDDKGRIAEILIDGESPVTTNLLAWLKKTAGTGKAGQKESGYQNTIWETAGWQFTFRQGGENEDAAFAITIVPAKPARK